MELIRAPLSKPAGGVIEVLLPVDRHSLAKRRWRGVAEDGREFGFDLAEPLHDGVPFFYAEGATYIIAQQPEPVFEILLGTPAVSARLGWLIGNLHFSVEIGGHVLRVAADSALRQMFVREQIDFAELSRVFHPFHHGHVH
jgi:urease accessory protein